MHASSSRLRIDPFARRELSRLSVEDCGHTRLRQIACWECEFMSQTLLAEGSRSAESPSNSAGGPGALSPNSADPSRLEPTTPAVPLSSRLQKFVKSADEILSVEKINATGSWNPFLTGDGKSMAPLINGTGAYQRPGDVFDSKTVIPVQAIFSGFLASQDETTKAAMKPLCDALSPGCVLRRPAHKFKTGDTTDTRVVLFGGKDAGDPQHTHIDEIVHELGRKHMRVIVQWAHAADDSLGKSTQGGRLDHVLGNVNMPAGSTHISLFSTGTIDGKPVVVTSNWGDDSVIDDMWPRYAVHLIAIDYQAGVQDAVPEATLAAWKHNADMWDCFAAMIVPFAGDDPFGYTKYQWNPLEVHDHTSAVAVATELAKMDWPTFSTKFGAFYCAEAQYSVANWGPRAETLIKESNFGGTRLGRIIRKFGQAPEYAGKDVAWKRQHPEIGWKWLVECGQANDGITPEEYACLGFPKPTDADKTYKKDTYSNRQGIYLAFLPEDVQGWQAYRPRNRDGLIASPLSAATVAWSHVRSYIPREKIAEVIVADILRAHQSGGPHVAGAVKAMTGGADPMSAIGQQALAGIAGRLAGALLTSALMKDKDDTYGMDLLEPNDRMEFGYVSLPQKQILQKAGYEQIESAEDRAKVMQLWVDFLAVLQHPDNTTQERLDAALLEVDRRSKALRVQRGPLPTHPTGPSFSSLMCFVPPGAWAMWAQQPFYSEAFTLRYVATAVHKGVARTIPALPAVDANEGLPIGTGPDVDKPGTPPEPPIVVHRPASPGTPSDPRPGPTAPQAPTGATGNSLTDEIAALLARPRSLKGIDLDVVNFATAATGERVLLPQDYTWEKGDKGPRIPLELCEYLAYKTSLAYEDETRIEAYLRECCPGIARFQFFSSSKSEGGGKLADAQGYGFVFERKAFVIFRGTENQNDWAINQADAMTDSLGGTSDRRWRKLEKRYGALLSRLGDKSPGRHVGFCIAWAAIKPQVEAWLTDVLEQGEAFSIVYSGHSLGGAMALVAAYDHARIIDKSNGERRRIAAVVTFGAPRVGGRAFADDYRRLLGDRTVLLESSGDIVPRIMDRWYYRMLYPLRQWAKAGVMQAKQQNALRFASVAETPWVFADEPPLNPRDIENALRDLKNAANDAMRQQAARQKKDAEQRAKQASNSEPESPAQPPREDGKSGQGANSKKNGSAQAETTPSWVYWAVAGVVVITVAGVTWYFVRRKLYSHDIEQRYALYLSTLSYQQLRAKHKGDLERAHRELDDHLRFVRGDAATATGIAGKKPFFGSLKDLPVRISVTQDPMFVKYLKEAFL